LDVPKKRFKNVIWRLHDNNKVIYGKKIYYRAPNEEFKVEFSIYDEKYKKDVLRQHLKKTILPFYAVWMLTILKFFYYQMNFIDKKTFNYIKTLILTLAIGMPDEDFVVLESL
jgi:hypothetical protein